MNLLFGTISLSAEALTGPTKAGISLATTVPEYPVNRGKPVPHVVGDELDILHYSFFFDETFCDVVANQAKLEAAFATKSPEPLVIGSGTGYRGKRYIVDALDMDIIQTDRDGNPVRVEGTISLLEDPLLGGLGVLLDRIAKGRAIARGGLVRLNAGVRRL